MAVSVADADSAEADVEEIEERAGMARLSYPLSLLELLETSIRAQRFGIRSHAPAIGMPILEPLRE